jgi:DNA-binding NtrC family response regulator
VPVVLLLGQSGSGKGVAARMLHDKSERAEGQFVEINCAAIPENLLEAELFGHERGAFSDAIQRREGLVEVADKGTLFLDEIGDLPLSLQAKLLKFVEERRFRRLGSNRVRSVDTRIVAATNQNLRARVDEGRFRADLYFRLSEITVTLPTLTQRGDDVIVLARHFLDEAARRYRKPFRGLAPETESLLRSYSWPGNVRELRAVINRVALMSEGDWVSPVHLPPEIAAAGVLEDPPLPTRPESGPIPTLEDVELAYIRRVLALCNGNKLLAAKYLGIARQTLARRLNEADARHEATG